MLGFVCDMWCSLQSREKFVPPSIAPSYEGANEGEIISPSKWLWLGCVAYHWRLEFHLWGIIHISTAGFDGGSRMGRRPSCGNGMKQRGVLVERQCDTRRWNTRHGPFAKNALACALVGGLARVRL